MNRRTGWTLAIAASALFCCVLSFYQATDAAPPAGTQPFANSLQHQSKFSIFSRSQNRNQIIGLKNESNFSQA